MPVYTHNPPPLLSELANTREMMRLKDIGMHCGCDYASFPVYDNVRCHYTRHMHSVEVANIVWNFTQDITQAVAGLLHDIATPAFAHTVDFLYGDYLTQESTEDKTAAFIKGSPEIMALLKQHGINAADVCDYHMYPIADNDTPMLSADRLEYTLGNGYIVYNLESAEIQAIFDDLTVAKNENNIDELCFRSAQAACSFVELSLHNSYWYVSDQSRFAMQYLADIVQAAIAFNVISMADLYTTETAVINRLKADHKTGTMWDMYTKISAVAAADTKPPDMYSVNIPAKKRYINPLVLTNGQPQRISDTDEIIRDKINEFLTLDFNRWVYAVTP